MLVPKIEASRTSVVESIEEHEGEDILSNYSVVKGKCVLDLLS
jgi:hypothetical protein